MNHSYSRVCSCAAWLCCSSQQEVVYFSTHWIWPDLAIALTLQKCGRGDMIQFQSLDLKRPCSFFSLTLAALRLLYEEAWVMRSHLRDEKSCGRESRYHSQQPRSTARSIHESKDQPVPSLCASWLQMHEWAWSAPHSAETRHHRWALHLLLTHRIMSK